MTSDEIKHHDEMCRIALLEMPQGPWTNEPNRLNWKAHGLDCMIVRQPVSGHLCGYVGVPPGHWAHGKKWDEVDAELDVHGGITYSEGCQGHVCHIPEPGEPDELWWHGFDCHHAGDLSPQHMMWHEKALKGEMHEVFIRRKFEGHDIDVYRTIDYVKQQTEDLAAQLAKVA
jgi:hypothetical protein